MLLENNLKNVHLLDLREINYVERIPYALKNVFPAPIYDALYGDLAFYGLHELVKVLFELVASVLFKVFRNSVGSFSNVI